MNLGEIDGPPTKIIIDSGSDITLVSPEAIQSMRLPLKMHQGKQVQLSQVTAKTTISGYVDLPLIFTTDQGPIQADVEAYIVKGMTTPLILGNDFADQYSLSIIRDNGESVLKFANTRRSMKLENSTSDSHENLEVQAFITKVKKLKHKIKYSIHQKEKKQQEKLHFVAQSQETIPLFSARNIAYKIKGSKTRNSYYLQINEFDNQRLTPLQITDSIVAQTEGALYAYNNSDCPIKVYKGEVLGKVINLENLDEDPENSSLEQITAFTHLTQAMMKAY